MFSLGSFNAPAAAVTPTPTSEAKTPLIAFLGSSADPFCAPLYADLEALCERQGWRLVSYDCKGNASGQRGQIKDLLRTEQVDAAVLYSVLEAPDLNAQVKRMAAACPVVTVGQRAGAIADRQVAVHIGGEEADRISALAKHLRGSVKRGQGALLLTDLPDETAEAQYADGLAQERLPVLGKNYTWGGAVYAERYLRTALDGIEDVGAVVCVSRQGTTGAWNALEEKKLRDSVKIASLFYDPAMADDLTLGDLDVAVAFSPKEAGEQLAEVLPKVLNKETVEEKPLTPVLLTPENVNETELGY